MRRSRLLCTLLALLPITVGAGEFTPARVVAVLPAPRRFASPAPAAPTHLLPLSGVVLLT